MSIHVNMNKFICFILVVTLFSCSNPVKTIKNEKCGKLKATYQLKSNGIKSFPLDENTASKPAYMQILRDTAGMRLLTFVNKYKNSVCIYNYDTSQYISDASYEKEGPNGILNMAGYYIKNMDSIYIYNRSLVELVLADSTGAVKKRISLKGNQEDWFSYYPQYDFKTVCPIFEYSGKLLLTGFYPFQIKDDFVDKFKFTACVNLNNDKIEFHHTYPHKIYGDNANWDDPVYMQVYPALLPSGQIVHSFTGSHDLYISPWDSDSVRVVYGGSNISKEISSIDWSTGSEGTPSQILLQHCMNQDLYMAILYDPWRKVYYRFMQDGISDSTTKLQLDKKNIRIIIMDDQFQYLGETSIGNGKVWNWSNSFVTKEGLNIEYVDTDDVDEDFLNFKIFSIEKI